MNTKIDQTELALFEIILIDARFTLFNVRDAPLAIDTESASAAFHNSTYMIFADLFWINTDAIELTDFWIKIHSMIVLSHPDTRLNSVALALVTVIFIMID